MPLKKSPLSDRRRRSLERDRGREGKIRQKRALNVEKTLPQELRILDRAKMENKVRMNIHRQNETEEENHRRRMETKLGWLYFDRMNLKKRVFNVAKTMPKKMLKMKIIQDT